MPWVSSEYPDSLLGWKDAEIGFWSLQDKTSSIPPSPHLISASYSFFLNSLKNTILSEMKLFAKLNGAVQIVLGK